MTELSIIPTPTTIQGLRESFNINQLQVARYFGQLLLTQIATQEVTRLQKLTHYRKSIEERLFDPALIKSLTRDELIQQYQMVTGAESNIYNHIQRVQKDISIEEIKTGIQILQQQMGANSESLEAIQSNEAAAAVASSILQRVSMASGKTTNN